MREFLNASKKEAPAHPDIMESYGNKFVHQKIIRRCNKSRRKLSSFIRWYLLKKKSLLDLLHSLPLSRLSLTVFTDVFAVCVLEFLLFLYVELSQAHARSFRREKEKDRETERKFPHQNHRKLSNNDDNDVNDY